MTKMAKKCSTDQSCIPKEVTSYKIHTLIGWLAGMVGWQIVVLLGGQVLVRGQVGYGVLPQGYKISLILSKN
jgi:hypothetical protein